MPEPPTDYTLDFIEGFDSFGMPTDWVLRFVEGFDLPGGVECTFIIPTGAELQIDGVIV